MPKIANRYLEVEPWAVVERGWHPERSRVSESIFSLGNGFMGVRGYFEEGYSGDHLLGSYFNGVYEERPVEHPQLFKGFVRRMHFLVNAVDWLYTRLMLDGETLDLARSRVTDFERRLDLRTGVLARRLVWTTRRGRRLRVTFLRFVSMANRALGGQRLLLEPLNFTGAVRVRMGLDFSPVHEEMGENFWTCLRQGRVGEAWGIVGRTRRTGQRLCAMLRFEAPARPRTIRGEKFIGAELTLRVRRGAVTQVDRLVCNVVEKRLEVSTAALWAAAARRARRAWRGGFDAALAAHTAWWTRTWEASDITIEGDPANQQGIRYGVFQLHQAYQSGDPTLNISAKGLTGEAYYGWAWWDTETYCLPFFLFTDPSAARCLLEFRYRTLPGALQRAREKDCRGARYPMGTIDGSESCGTWQHGDLEIHVSAAVAYGIWHYVQVTGDTDFLRRQGLEMLLQICRYYASRGAWSPRTGEFGLWGVMGPDEFHMMVHNNTYTNLLVKRTFEFTLATAARLRRSDPARWRRLAARIGLRPAELRAWQRMAARMRILFDPRTGLFEQHDGYFDLPHVNVEAIPARDFPLYHHWAYYRLFRSDMIKQPDVLLFLFLYNRSFPQRVKRVNYDYYASRCVHESSLSPAIHSIIAAELGRTAEASRFFRHATRLDLDDYNRNAALGLHTTSMAAAWMNVVYGFGGLRSDGSTLAFVPVSLPSGWRRLGFRIRYRGALLEVSAERQGAAYRVVSGPAVRLLINGRQRRVGHAWLRVSRRT